jgi:type II secretory pathway component GspD/PulD (secretin)
MGLMDFVEMASDAMEIEINASTLDSSGKHRVTVSRSDTMTREQAMARFLSQLSIQGFTLVQDEDMGFYRVVRLREARDDAIPFVTDPAQLPDNDLLVNHAIRLNHFPVDGMARTLRSFAPATSRLIPDAASGLLLITDSARAMTKYREISARLDTPKGAEEAREYLKSSAKSDTCGPVAAPAGSQPGGSTILVMLIALIGLLLGFLIRGYVIRRIEGGL